MSKSMTDSRLATKSGAAGSSGSSGGSGSGGDDGAPPSEVAVAQKLPATATDYSLPSGKKAAKKGKKKRSRK